MPLSPVIAALRPAFGIMIATGMSSCVPNPSLTADGANASGGSKLEISVPMSNSFRGKPVRNPLAVTLSGKISGVDGRALPPFSTGEVTVEPGVRSLDIRFPTTAAHSFLVSVRGTFDRGRSYQLYRHSPGMFKADQYIAVDKASEQIRPLAVMNTASSRN